MLRHANTGIAHWLAILLLLTIANAAAHADDGAVVLPQSGSEPVTVRLLEDALEGPEADPADLLQVFVGAINACCEDRTPIAGRHTLENDIVTFTPAFDFAAGQDYVAQIRMPATDVKRIPFAIPSENMAVQARVTEIYPSGETLPENVLRFYFHFSVPMAPHVAFDHIKLRDASGDADEAAFMKFKQELWNEDRTRLTVLIDPGRIKRDVATNLELGPALLAGRQYTLSVDGGWVSADGASVLSPFSRTIAVSEALRKRPDVKFWQATSPCVGTREPLRIDFDRPFDRHLLGKDLQVVAGDDRVIGGVIQIGEGERSWSFTPDEPWLSEDVRVAANVELEDVAGNNFRELLDQVGGTEEFDLSATVLPVNVKTCQG